jgi:hypothetical protein
MATGIEEIGHTLQNDGMSGAATTSVAHDGPK